MAAGIIFSFRRKTAAAWTALNPILMAGELGLETDTRTFKFGDGVTVWTSLAYAGTSGTTTLTGDVTGGPGAGSLATLIATNAVTNAKLAQMATLTLKGNNTATLANASDLTAAQIKILLAIATADVSGLGTLATQNGTFSGTHSGSSSGTNTGDQTIALTGAVTGSGTGTFATTLATAIVALANMANLAANSIIGNNTGTAAAPTALTPAQITAMLIVAPRVVAGTTDTPTTADAQGYIQCTGATATTVTIPPNSTQAFVIGTTIAIEQNGAGVVTLAPGAGVTLNSRGALVNTAGQYAVVQVKKTATNIWTVLGDLA